MIETTRQHRSVDLRGLTVLVVEDNYFMANEICSALSPHGAHIAGPAANLRHARELLRRVRPDCAILDINLRGERTFGLAAQLARRGTSVIFATGYDTAIIPAPLASAPRLEKPVNLGVLLHAVHASMARRRGAPENHPEITGPGAA